MRGTFSPPTAIVPPRRFRIGRCSALFLSQGLLSLLPQLHSSTARAELGGDGSTISTNDYVIDGYQGPVLASSRVIGLAGAYVAVSEFVEGNTQNPAAPAVRSEYSFSHIDYDIGVGFTFPNTVTGIDFFNSGKQNTSLPDTTQDGFVFFELSGTLQMGPWGFGAASSIQQYGLASADNSQESLRTQLGIFNFQIARAFLDGQLVLGIGARLGTLKIFDPSTASTQQNSVFNSVGIAPEFGLVYRPQNQSYRLGASFRAPLHSGVDNTATQGLVLYPDSSAPLFLPRAFSQPWELALGAAYRFGRPFNTPWLDPKVLTEELREKHALRQAAREKKLQEARVQAAQGDAHEKQALRQLEAILDEEALRDEAELLRAERETEQFLKSRFDRLPRRYLLVTAALFANGSLSDAVGIESFFQRTVHRSGESVTLSPRLGLETEVIPYWLTLRAGTYLEPTRFTYNNQGSRLHGTFGTDLRLGNWNVFGAWPDHYVWRLRTNVDVSRNYFNWGVSIGGYY